MKTKLDAKQFKEETFKIFESIEDIYKNSVILYEYCKQKEYEEPVYFITSLTTNIRKSLSGILARAEKLYPSGEHSESDFIKNIKPLNPNEYIIED